MKKTMKTAAVIGLAVLPILGLVSPVLAAGTVINIAPGGQFSSLRTFSIADLVRNVITLALVIAALAAFGFLLFGGIIWITSGGDKAKTEQARNTITAALVGLLIVFGTWAIIQLVQALFPDVNLLQLNLNFDAVTGRTGGAPQQ